MEKVNNDINTSFMICICLKCQSCIDETYAIMTKRKTISIKR